MRYAVLAYIPVVHKGTLDFLHAYPGRIYLIDNVVGAHEYVYFERDVRALSAHEVAVALRAHGFQEVQVLAPGALPTLSAIEEPIIAPNDEAVQFFVERYCPDLVLQYVDVFLRWTKIISTQEYVVPPHRILTKDAFAREVIAKLHNEAQRSADWWRQVAAAAIQNGKVLLSDHNRHLPTPHALTINGDPRSNLDAGQRPDIGTAIHGEAAVVARAAREGISLKGTDIYVTTFPCAVCARLLSESGIVRLYYDKGYSTLDAEDILNGAGIEIVKVEMA